MTYSRFAKVKEKTAHERFCDYEVRKCESRSIRGGSKYNRATTTARLTNLELKKSFEKLLTV